MELSEYARYDGIGLRRLIEAGEVTAAEVEAVARRAIEGANAAVNGLAAPPFDTALTHDGDGPLGGVPFLLKDSGPMAAGVEFCVGSRGLDGVRARHDHDLMRRFRAAGLAALGRTTVPELGLSFATEPVRYGPTRNPWDLGRGAGGSSGGAAALVAAGAVPIAHANDSAGSTRIPASCCGLVGLKPSRGRTPSGPDSGDPAFGAVSEFVVTRTLRDAALVLDLVHGYEPGDKYTAPPPSRPYAEELSAIPRGLRVAVSTEAVSGAPVDAEVAVVTNRVAAVLADLGHEVTEARPEPGWDDVITAARAECVAIAMPFLTAPRRPDPAKLEAVPRQILAEAEVLTAVELMAMLDAQNRVSRAVGRFFAGYDLLVTPTIARLPAPHGVLSSDRDGYTTDSWLRTLFGYGPFTVQFNLAGQPALSLPLGHSENGLPIGVQLAAPYGRDDLLFAVAARLEEAMPWQHRLPPFTAGAGDASATGRPDRRG
ncbi:amidase [Amycolatopsis minnesotensis]|uniref:Amidase family protein n=1 Tax=Amycolatopsis minnesotensis TaxID=337894 RepID=A0ABP5BGU9_9PSEU